jgi:hypothetical protein
MASTFKHAAARRAVRTSFIFILEEISAVTGKRSRKSERVGKSGDQKTVDHSLEKWRQQKEKWQIGSGQKEQKNRITEQ